MRSLVALLLAAGLSGCAAGAPRAFVYSWGTVVKADPVSVDRRCLARGGRWDNGRPLRFGERSGGCWIASKRELWVRWDRPEALTHELAHVDGVKDPSAEGYDW